MIDDDEDWIEVDEIGDAPRDPRSRSGLLVVPGIAVSEAAFLVEASFFKVDDGPGSHALFVECDEVGRETAVANIEEFRTLDYCGPDDSETLEEWIASFPRDEEREAARAAAVFAARGNL